MTPERARELLGGLSSGILTPEERQTLFEAALHDQTLFNEVADELEFATFLQSPETRKQLANRIEVEPERRGWFGARSRWFALMGAVAAASVVFVAVWNLSDHAVREVPSQAVIAPAPARPPAQPPAVAQVETKSDAKPAAKPEVKPRAEARRAAPAEVEPVVELKSKENLAAAGKDQPAAVADKREAPRVMASAPPPPPPAAAATPAPRGPEMAGGSAGRLQEFSRLEASSRLQKAPPKTVASANSLTGTIRDPAGGPVANATVDIVNPETNSSMRTSADASGRFTASALTPGVPYTVRAQAPGFKQQERTGIVLGANGPTTVDIPLEVGAVSETVAVTAASALVSISNVQQVAVLDFLNSTPQEQSGQQVADMVSNQLLDGGQVRIIDRQKVQQAAERQRKSNTRPPSAKEAAALGRTLGADAVIMGSVKAASPGQGGGGGGGARDAASSNVAVTAEVIDTKKGQATAKVAANGPSLQGAANQVGTQLESRLGQPLNGSVTRVDGASISVTFDGQGAPRIGAHLDVFRGRRKIGEMTLTSAYGKTAAGTFSGSNPPRPGDRVISSR